MIQREVSHEALQRSVLALQSTQAPDIGDGQAGQRAPPPIQGLFSTMMLATAVAHVSPRLNFLENPHALLFWTPLALHTSPR